MPDNEGVLAGNCLAVFAQQWQNLLGECRSSIILRPGVLLKWECHQPPLDNDAHTFSNQEQETRSTEGRGQPAGEGGHRASL